MRAALRAKILELLRSRSGTMCPSEAPRRLRPADWRCGRLRGRAAARAAEPAAGARRRRPLMEATREEARALAAQGLLHITQRGRVLDHSKPWRGPIRLRLARGAPAAGAGCGDVAAAAAN